MRLIASAFRHITGIQHSSELRTLTSAAHQERRYVLCVDITLLIALTAILIAGWLWFPR